MRKKHRAAEIYQNRSRLCNTGRVYQRYICPNYNYKLWWVYEDHYIF